MGFGIDFDDSDFDDDSDEEDVRPTPPVRGSSGVPPGAGAGGPNHRPYVGGFAAAAYEAARAHHTESSTEPKPKPKSKSSSSSSSSRHKKR